MAAWMTLASIPVVAAVLIFVWYPLLRDSKRP